MKKILTTVVIFAIICCAALSAACNGDKNQGNQVRYSETFAGAISAEQYDSEEDAAKNFLKNELDGEAVKTSYAGMEKKGQLTEAQIADLDTGDAIGETDAIVSADVVDVKYTKQTSGVTGLAAYTGEPEEDYFVFTVYIIVISPNGSTEYVYRYFVPKANNGDILTKSYFEDVLNPEKYANCTQKYSMNTTSGAMGVSMSATADYTIKIADETASIHMQISSPNTNNYPITYDTQTIDGYFENGADGFNAFLTLNNWEDYSDGAYAFEQYNIYDMDSFVTMCLPQYDYSYYVKTDYGFKLQSDFIREIVKDALKQSVGADSDFSANIDYYVVEGRLYSVVCSMSLTMKTGGYTVTATATQNLSFSDFGTTTVEKPAALING